MTDPTPTPEPRYLAKLLDLARRGVLRPGFQDVAIFHDTWCAQLTGAPCNCDADICLMPSPADTGQN
jgi:hypothetical protein